MERFHVTGRLLGLTTYAARRLRTRRISVPELRALLADPTSVTPSRSFAFRFICRRTVHGRRLAVVIRELPGERWWEVVTAWVEGKMGRLMASQTRVAIGGSTPPLAVEFAPRSTAVYLRLTDEPAARTVEIEEGSLADYDEDGKLVGFEIVGLDDPEFVHVLARLKERFADEAPVLRSVEAVPA